MLWIGWLGRRRAWLTDESTGVMGRFVVDVAFPALTFTQMLRTVDAETMRGGMLIFALGIGVLTVAYLAAYGTSYLFAKPGQRPSFVFLGGMPNWIFLPLALVPVVVGDAGTKVVLLFNIPSQLFLWTVGVWVLRGGFRGAHSFGHLLMNPGLIATLGGIVVALVFPTAAKAEHAAWDAILTALNMLGSITVPLSLIVTGAQLAEVGMRGAFDKSLAGLLATRLLIAPVITILLLELLLPVDRLTLSVVEIIACMPVGVSCALFIDRFGGDRDLAATSITISTLLSLVTLPLFLLFLL